MDLLATATGDAGLDTSLKVNPGNSDWLAFGRRQMEDYSQDSSEWWENAAPWPMKTRTIASRWRYDVGAGHAQKASHRAAHTSC
ncbi:hypothetical protein [Bradyrhizobium cenepequi]|uniref:hypothetical protein n=1 Tax=Bradyrhizobium cenepequi TaxID=2821403 RepID=UPI001CE3991B|nr:hypothetical protein [Bradyrhizobium cenepequi]MCA6112489.1 hypothetical protein [Bradyrhizobium cenepequi]